MAAAVVCAVAGPGAVLYASQGERTAPLTATDARSGVWARVTAEDETWGTGVRLEVRDGTGPRSCRLVAVGRDGSEQTVTSWTVPGHGDRSHTVRGGAALHPDEIDRYEVRTADGGRLVTLPAG